jgi:hypothetical protein
MDVEVIEDMLNSAIAEGAARGRPIELILELGTDDTHIDVCEQTIGVPIPLDLRVLLKWSNGMTLSVNRDPRLSADLYVSSLADLVHHHEHYALRFSETGDLSEPDRYWKGFLVLASYGEGICVLDVSHGDARSYTVVDINPDVETGTGATPIAANLEEWFRRMLASAVSDGSLIYWLNHSADE